MGLRIAILPSLKRPITPTTTSSRPRVIFDLVSELVKRGHKVTILGTGDSVVAGASVVPVVPTSLNSLPPAENPFYQHTAYLTLVIKAALDRQGEFDLIHNHMYPEFLPLLATRQVPSGGLSADRRVLPRRKGHDSDLSSPRVLPGAFPQEHPQGDPFLGAPLPPSPARDIPILTTVHAQMTREMAAALGAFPGSHLAAISARAKDLSGIGTMHVVHNGIDTDFFVPDESRPREYLLFVGRMSRGRDEKGNFLDPKGVTNAIKVAQATGEKLKIVGNVEDPAFFETLIKPHVSDKIEFVGKVSAEQLLTREDMRSLFQGAKAFLFPINWEEPFGLVMAEALSCGVPVVAFGRGSVSEIVRDGLTGFVVDPGEGVDGLESKIVHIPQINIKECRNDAVARFSKTRMTDDYERLYLDILHR